MSLLDLQPETLARIAALVSRAPKEKYASFDFQVCCSAEEYCELSQMRATCRTLRHACRDAIAGIAELVIGYQTKKDPKNPFCRKRFQFSIDTVLTLPYLVALEDINRLENVNLCELFEKLPPLKRFGYLDIGYPLSKEEADVLMRRHASSLQSLELPSDTPVFKEYLCSPSRLNLVELSLSLDHCNERQIMHHPLLYNLRKLRLRGQGETASITNQFQLMTLLESFTLDTYDDHLYFDYTSLQRIPNLKYLCMMMFDDIETTERYLNVLKTLKVPHLDDRCSSLMVGGRVEAFRGLYDTLRCLNFEVETCERHCGADIEYLSCLELHPECEINITLTESWEYGDDSKPIFLDISPLHAIQQLTSLEIKSFESVSGLACLSTLQKLRSVVISNCDVHVADIMSFAARCRSRASLRIENCYAAGKRHRFWCDDVKDGCFNFT